MKKLMLQFILVLIPFMLIAQNTAVDKLMEKYNDEDGFVTVYITKHMFSLFANIETDDADAEEFLKTINSIDGIKVLSAVDSLTDVNLYEEIMETLPMKEYEELMVVHEKNQDVKFLIKKKGEVIKELLMVVGGKKSNSIVSITGVIDLKSIAKISKSVGIEGFEHMKKLEKKYH